jgi:hypothetical protein
MAKFLRRQEYRPNTRIEKATAKQMHDLGHAYFDLARYWLSSQKVEIEIARAAVEAGAAIHVLADMISELADEKKKKNV